MTKVKVYAYGSLGCAVILAKASKQNMLAVTYPVNNVIQCLNNWGLVFTSFNIMMCFLQLGTEKYGEEDSCSQGQPWAWSTNIHEAEPNYRGERSVCV